MEIIIIIFNSTYISFKKLHVNTNDFDTEAG